MAEHWHKAGDLLPFITTSFTDGEGAGVDIANADVFFTMRPIRSVTPTIDHAAAMNDQNGDGSDGTLGTAHYEWVDGDADEPGGYYAEWAVEFAGGAVLTFPNDGYDTIALVANLEAVGS